ncbi:MAG: TonB-dependent receptor [Acidobacteria bacterium]|nr:TonB-dependent receptor [Acidobacteriota bacterium]
MQLQRLTRCVSYACFLAGISLLVLNLCGTPVLGQTTTATIRGTVYDEAGAVIGGASVMATDEKTGLSRSIVSERNGTYLMPKLPVGTYTLTVEKEGFKRLKLTAITLQVDQIAQIDATLTVGEITESIEVASGAPIINTTTPEVGELIDNRRIVELPLNGRQFLQLAQLSAGVTTSPSGGVGGQLAGFNGPRITSNGGREDANYFTLDGVNATDPLYNTLTLSPSVDAIQEFKVEQNLYSAEYGRLAGAQVNIIIKSGSNEFHGSAYEFLRNDVLDARNFFDIEKPPFRQNQYGFSLGGPIIKNRTFFFGNFEGLRIRKGITAAASVPTAAQRRGDLSAFSGTIKDPLTGNPFPGNIIPSDRIDPSSAEILAFLPLPNSSGGARNLITAPSLTNDTDQFLIRIDHRLTEKDSIYGRFSFSNTDEFDPFGTFAQFGAGGLGIIPGFGNRLSSDARNLVVNWTRSFTPTLIGEFKFGYSQVEGGQLHENSGNNFGQRNSIRGTAQTGPLSGFPRYQTGVFTDFGDITVPFRRLTQIYQYGGDVSWSRGNHEIKFGGQGQWAKFDPTVDFFARGQFIYFGTFTGNAFADFLLGLPGFSLAGQGDLTGRWRGGSLAFYYQDNWHVSPRLTLNLGLRWEYFGSPSESRERQANFDPVTRRFILASEGSRVNTSQQLPGAQQFLEQFFPFVTSEEAGLPQSLFERDLNNFSPRFGFAWDVFNNQKTVLRGGYGLFFNQSTRNLLALQLTVPPFFNFARVPSFLSPPAQANVHVTLDVPAGSNAFFFPLQTDYRDGYVQQWNLSLQQSITKDLVVEARYVGTKGTKLYTNDFSYNLAPPGDPATAVQRRPFPQFAASSRISSIANSSYNALQLRATQRLSHGLAFLVNYTFGKSLDTDSLGQSLENGQLGQDPRNRRLEWGRSGFDVKHNFVANFTYDLPLKAEGGWKRVVEGWQLGGILSLQTGRPFHVSVNGDRAGTGDSARQRPDAIGNPNLPSSQRRPDRWFNTDALVLQPVGRVGTLGRNTIDADGFKTLDFSVRKNTFITERVNVQFRAEFFNIFNFVNFGFPNITFQPAGGINAPTGTHNVSPILGHIFSAKDPRIIQFGLKLIF